MGKFDYHKYHWRNNIVENKGKYFWFYKLSIDWDDKYYGWFEQYKSLPYLLQEVELDYGRLYPDLFYEMQNQKEFSPIDESKNTYTRLNTIEDIYRCYQIYVYDEVNSKYIECCIERTWNKNYNLHVGDHILYYKKNLSADELLKLKPSKLNKTQYLMNGRIYES